MFNDHFILSISSNDCNHSKIASSTSIEQTETEIDYVNDNNDFVEEDQGDM